jgi:hypothetical protein
MPDAVSRVRMAAFAPVPNDLTQVGGVVHLIDLPAGAFTRLSATAYARRWTPTAAELAHLRRFCSPDAEARLGTSIWFEDVVGHVAPPEQIVWQRSPEVVATATPAAVTLEVATTVLVRAWDKHLGVPVEGVVRVSGWSGEALTDVQFTHTFKRHRLAAPSLTADTASDPAPDLRAPRDPAPPDEPEEPLLVDPTVTVHVPGCVPFAVAMHYDEPPPALAPAPKGPSEETPPIVAPPTASEEAMT